MKKKLTPNQALRAATKAYLAHLGGNAVFNGYVEAAATIKQLQGLELPTGTTSRMESRKFLRETIPAEFFHVYALPKARKKELRPEEKCKKDFLDFYEWRALRMKAILKYGRRCMCCGATPDDGIVIHVDHIKPRKLFPELSLSLDNLQILCGTCNHGKGNWDQTDWRKPQ